MTSTNDTIVAQATTTGKSSLNVIRLSGELSLKIACALTQKPSSFFAPRVAKLARIYFQNGQLLDECILLYFQAPHSYTTQEVIEFQCHGGTFIAKCIIDECIKQGARLAIPGEFTKRAFLGGRIDLSQAEAIAKLINASSATAHAMLMRHLKGEMQEFCDQLRHQLITILAHSEVCIDYASEDLPDTIEQNLQQQLQSIQTRLSSLLEQSIQKKNLFEGHRLCIIGKPNVGKSSLLNAFLNQNRAIVSDIEGTTRDSIEETFFLGDHAIRLIDTAGIRNTQDSIESLGIQRSLEKLKESDIILALFDGSQKANQQDLAIIELLGQAKPNQSIITLLNKSDLGYEFEQSLLQPYPCFKLSLKEDIHCDRSSFRALKDHLQKLICQHELDEALLLTSQYQYQQVLLCIQAIKDSTIPLQNGELELFSFHINEAISAIAAITKPYEYSHMLDCMFRDFCLGK